METETDTARFFTRARRIPVLLGKMHDGTPIPYGPYTIGQVIGVVVTIYGLSKTTSLWARADLFTNAVVFVGLVLGVCYLLGKIPHAGRNPFSMAADAFALLTAPKTGMRNGSAVTVRGPHRVRQSIVGPTGFTVSPPLERAATPETEPVTSPAVTTPARSSAGRSKPQPQLALTGVGRLLAQATHDQGDADA